MGWNGTGGFASIYNWVNDKNNSIPITASRMDAQEADYTTNGFGNCVTRDGQSPATANLPMGGYKHTAIADAAALNQYASASQIVTGVLAYQGTVGGTGDAITLTSTVAPGSYTAGQTIQFFATASNTTAVTINRDGLGTKALKQADGSDLTSGMLASGRLVVATYNGTAFILANGAAGAITPAQGGTGITSYAVGDLIYASGATTLAKLADVATGNALISGGVGVAPAWGKIALGSAVSGTLPVANGGIGTGSAGIAAFNNITGLSAAGTTGTTSTNLVFSTSPTLVTPALGTPSSGNLSNCTGYAAANVTGLGTAATQNTGTSGANVPLLNGGNTWSSAQLVPVGSQYNGKRIAHVNSGTGNATGLISWGTGAPGTLDEGQIYLRHA